MTSLKRRLVEEIKRNQCPTTQEKSSRKLMLYVGNEVDQNERYLQPVNKKISKMFWQ